MINWVWFAMMVAGIATAAARGDVGIATSAVLNGAGRAVEIAVSLIGLLAFWSGLMRIAEEAGLTRLLARLLRPLARRLFPSVPPDSPAMGAILLAMSANALGLGNAATPLGLKAMAELQRLNPDKHQASTAQCTFVALCTSGLTLIPASVIAVRTAAGSVNPSEIVGPTLLATAYSTVVALAADAFFRRRNGGR